MAYHKKKHQANEEYKSQTICIFFLPFFLEIMLKSIKKHSNISHACFIIYSWKNIMRKFTRYQKVMNLLKSMEKMYIFQRSINQLTSIHLSREKKIVIQLKSVSIGLYQRIQIEFFFSLPEGFSILKHLTKADQTRYSIKWDQMAHFIPENVDFFFFEMWAKKSTQWRPT